MGNSVISALLIIVCCLEVGLNTLNKAATNKGMSNYVFILYSNALALLVLLPSTFIYHRSKPCAKLTFPILYRIFLLALLSCSGQTLFYVGIQYSSPTLASAILDLIPAFTFIVAVVLGMEKLVLRAKSSQAKAVGTLILITGAFMMTFYKGPAIISHESVVYNRNIGQPLLSTQSNWIIGSSLLTTASFLVSLLYIVQAWIMKDYPQELMVTVIACGFVTILSSVVALIAEKDSNAWKIKPDLKLITICYSGILMVGVRSVVQTWAVKKKGPVFVAMFMPLGMVVAVLMGVAFLHDDVYTGSVIGASIITLGFYAVMWGKACEERVIQVSETSFNQTHQRLPLLSSKNDNF
ncbi:PREDICTED: WAT1-related protein At3g28050-like [Nicotiana attenuata]|uniref:WAT1-related protein n=1 Tax=Nicotiana attenuata TaxID=49451 RepID=A0A1J6KF54_NICAT|nr:PREDICTED: WAT1-related protein At3g28050-like [Nicotiana attenuata]OIT20527.1 wat1-related protein [Nicotiana attenuata]